MSKPFDPTKPVMTSEKRFARIIATDSDLVFQGVPFPIIAEFGTSARKQVDHFQRDGRRYVGEDSSYDLINIPEEPKWRAWKPEEVPIGAVMRTSLNGNQARYSIVGTYWNGGVCLGRPCAEEEMTFEQAFANWEHSIDPIGTPDAKRTWLKCGVLEAQ